MSTANQKQVAGSHYKSEFQHWDFVIDTQMPYVLGCATKYLTRWKKKNGVEDLTKAIHYLEKAQERRHDISTTWPKLKIVEEFLIVNSVGIKESDAFRNICMGNFNLAIDIIQLIINEEKYK